MTPIAVVPIVPTKYVTLLAKHEDKGFLVYVQEGDIETDAVVDLADTQLKLFVPAELIESGNSLAWMTRQQLLALDVEFDVHQPEEACS